MGSYASVKIKEYEIFLMKSYVDPSIMSIFAETDKTVKIEKEPDDEEYKYKIICYKTDTKTAKMRLNIMGFNLRTLESLFSRIKNQNLEYFDNMGYKIKRSFKKFLDNFTFK